MRNIALLAVCLIIAACGFHPVYGVNKYTSTGVEEFFAQTDIGNIPDREGQYLRNALIDRFYRGGRPTNPKYRISLSPVTESVRDLDVTIDSDATRGQLQLRTQMNLINIETQETLLTRNLRSITSFNIIESEYANRVSEQNTRENALDDLARQVEEQLAFYFKREHSTY